jgi:hypothetical protein
MRYIFIKLLHKFENSLSDLVDNKYLFLIKALNIRIIIIYRSYCEINIR